MRLLNRNINCPLLFSHSVFETGGNLVVQEVAVQPLTQDLLHSSVNGFYPSNMFHGQCFIETEPSLNVFSFCAVRTVTLWTRAALV